jgi:hypothetical protein
VKGLFRYMKNVFVSYIQRLPTQIGSILSVLEGVAQVQRVSFEMKLIFRVQHGGRFLTTNFCPHVRSFIPKSEIYS